ncbi:hypothetical protein [Reticulibacter mediterranei]|nr:hypothetical protein [Reticulibacter mediterranei]
MLLKEKISSSQALSSVRNKHLDSHQSILLLSLLLVSLLLTVAIRVWLTLHTHGVIAGDEAMVGIQAEHILRGEHPVYYYGQPYMGSFEAYVMAGIFFFWGPSVWALRAEPVLISLVLIFLTWRFAIVLANAAHLPQRAKVCFVSIATLIAAFPPLYDMVEEMRAKGGYLEIFTVMLWLLFCTWSLVYRWQNNAKPRELLLRWVGLGFLLGIGLWIDPLVAYALATIAIWLALFFMRELITTKLQNTVQLRRRRLKEALFALIALPALLVGFGPAIYWGKAHQWENIQFIFSTSGNGFTQGLTLQERVYSILRVGKVYLTCMLPRTLGGSLPSQPGVTIQHHHILTVGLVITFCCLLVCGGGFVLSWLRPHIIPTRLRQLTSLSLLFFLCTSTLFVVSSVSVRTLLVPCGPWDVIGRYTVPLVVVLPFLIASVLTLPLMMSAQEMTLQEKEQGSIKKMKGILNLKPSLLKKGVLFLLIVYFAAQSAVYQDAHPDFTFQGPGALVYPASNDPIIAYMEREHIHYAWATGWIADPITFKTNERIIVSEPHGRIEANNQAVLHAKQASLIVVAMHKETHPAILKALDDLHVQYRLARFYSEPGLDVLVITPLNRTLSPFDLKFATVFHHVF